MSGDGVRTFKAFGDKTYRGPFVKPVKDEPNQTPRADRFPVFVDHEGKFFDIDYIPIPRPQEKVEKGHASPLSASPLERAGFKPDYQLFEEIPQPSDYNSYSAYEQALVNWRWDVEAALGYLQLPHVMGRTYMRPKVIKETRRQDSFRRPTVAPSKLEDNFNDLVDSQVGDEEEHDQSASETKPEACEGPEATQEDHSDSEDWNNTVLPWETQLVPEEPRPEFYDSFPDYELALDRWACAVSTMEVIPPHASQFVELARLVPVKAINQGAETSARSAGSRWKTIRGFIPLVTKKKVGNLFAKLPEEVKERIHGIFHDTLSSILIRNAINPATFGQGDNKAMIPDPVPIAVTSRPCKAWGKLLTHNPGVNVSLDEMMRKDSEMKEDYTPNAMDMEIEGSISQPVTEFGCQSDELYSTWDNWLQRDTLDERRKMYEAVAPDFAKEGAERAECKWTLEEVEKVLSYHSYMNVFQDWSESGKSSDGKSHCVAMAAVVTADNFTTVLKWMDDYSGSIAAKIALLVTECLKGDNCVHIVTKLIENKDTLSMRKIATCLHYFDSHPPKLFDLGDTAFHIKQAYGEEILKHVHTVLWHGYIESVTTATEDHKEFEVVHELLKTELENSLEGMAGILGESVDALSWQLFGGINHRSKAISRAFLFVLVKLIEAPHEDIMDYLMDEDTDLFNMVRDMAMSRLSHVQNAAKEVLSSIQKNTAWRKWLLSQYSTSKERDLLIKDLTGGSMSLSAVLCDFLCEWLDSVPKDNNLHAEVGFLAKQMVFPKVLQKITHEIVNTEATPPSCPLLPELSKFSSTIEDTSHRKQYEASIRDQVKKTDARKIEEKNKMVYDMSRLLLSLSQCFSRLNVIEAVGPNVYKSKDVQALQQQKRGGGVVFCVLQYQDLISMLDILQMAPKDHYSFKTNMLVSLRLCLKVETVYELVQKDNKLYTTLKEMCKDPKSIDFNRNAWMLFYQMVRYHPSAMDNLIKSDNVKHLSTLLDMIASHSHSIVVTNSLHYLAKIFTLITTEHKRIEAGKPSVSDVVLKSYDKSLKSLNDHFIKKKLFVKYHMLYRKYHPDRKGAPYQKLVRFYQVLLTEPACQKLLKSAMKESNYKEGLVTIANLDKVDGPEGGAEDGAKAKTKRFA